MKLTRRQLLSFTAGAVCCAAVSSGWFPHGSPATNPANVPGYDVFVLMQDSNSFSGRDIDYQWGSTDYEHTGTPGTYSSGLDSIWNAKLWQWGWNLLNSNTTGTLYQCTSPTDPPATVCHPDIQGYPATDPKVSFATKFLGGYISNYLLSNRTGVILIPCSAGGTAFGAASPFNRLAAVGSGGGTTTLNINPDTSGLYLTGTNTITVTDTTTPGNIPGGSTTVSSVDSATHVTLAETTSIASGDTLIFTDTAGDWLPGGHHLEQCIFYTNVVMNSTFGVVGGTNKLKAVLFEGGVNDVGISPGNQSISYFQNTYFGPMVAAFRARVTGATNVPFMIGGMPLNFVAAYGGGLNDASRVQTALQTMASTPSPPIAHVVYVGPTSGVGPQLGAPEGSSAIIGGFNAAYTTPMQIRSITPSSNPCQLFVVPYTLAYGPTYDGVTTSRVAGALGNTSINGNWLVQYVDGTGYKTPLTASISSGSNILTVSSGTPTAGDFITDSGNVIPAGTVVISFKGSGQWALSQNATGTVSNESMGDYGATNANPWEVTINTSCSAAGYTANSGTLYPIQGQSDNLFHFTAESHRALATLFLNNWPPP